VGAGVSNESTESHSVVQPSTFHWCSVMQKQY